MPPQRVREPALRIGDVVTVAVRFFGETYAREKAAKEPRRVQWNSDTLRDSGTVREKASDGQLLLDFDDDEELRWWARKLCRFDSRPGGSSGGRSVVVPASESEPDSDPESDDGDEDDRLESSEGDDDADEAEAPAEAQAVNAPNDLEGWTRDDDCAEDERRKAGYMVDNAPVWLRRSSLPDDESTPLFFFEACKSWMPMDFIKEMADRMQECGRAKGTVWAGWRVTVDDLLQWIGVWYYFLAFPQNSDRRAYFQGESSKRFGPRHLIEEWLRRGDNGEKGVRWFENMESVFNMPTGDADADDPFFRVRHMWEKFRKHFTESVAASWLLCLDESMVEWQGRGMPGLMVVPRKPVPLGLEVHTLCDALSGILINYEVYEGKAAMEKKKFVGDKTDIGEINKSTALTLRVMEPYFGTG